MKRLAICSLAVLALLTSCGVAKDDIAATVNGHDITVKEVDDLARSEFISRFAEQMGTGLVSSPDGTTGAATQRLALSLLIQTAAYEDEAKQRGIEVSIEERDAAAGQIDQFLGESKVSDKIRTRLATWLAVGSALGSTLDVETPEIPETPVVQPEPVTPEQVAAYMEENRDLLGRMTCIEGFVLPAEKRDLAQAAVDRGDSVESILGDATLTAQILVESGAASCLSESQVTDPTIKPLVFDGPIGQWGSTAVETTQPDDPTKPLSLAVFIRPTVRDDATNIPAIVDAITQSLEQQAQDAADAANQESQQAQDAVLSAAQADIDKALAKLVQDADIEVDPRYGSFDAAADGGFSLDLVKPPTAPVDRAPATTEPSLLDPAAG